MKKIIPLLLLLFACTTLVFAEGDEYEDDQDIDNDDPALEIDESDDIYRPNGNGDQYIKIALMGEFPLNFDDKLKTGGAAEIGYHRFLNSFVALGFDVSFGYNPTIGSNMFTYVPMVLTTTVQPYIGPFEFPLTFGIGAALESYLNRNYFPGLILKGQGGAFYRVTESWSFGVESEFMYMPQWYSKHSDWNDYGLFLSAGLVARYHF
ncbi:MAG: hypothetical protein K6E51_01215 [Treponema sp.]|nr:hypothetical protein [Treponema sp.]